MHGDVARGHNQKYADRLSEQVTVDPGGQLIHVLALIKAVQDASGGLDILHAPGDGPRPSSMVQPWS